MFRLDRRTNPLRWAVKHVPRNQMQLEQEVKGVLRIVFWIMLLAPVVLLPAYYLIVALGG